MWPDIFGGVPVAEDRLGGRATTAHGLGDPLALQRVDEAGGIADEKHPSRGRRGPDHAHLEPAAEAA